MNVDVDKLKVSFTNKLNDLYNQEVYFLATCYKFPSKYHLETSVLDEQLQIWFETHNQIILGGKCEKYCKKGTDRSIKIKSISLDSGEGARELILAPEVVVITVPAVPDNTQNDW